MDALLFNVPTELKLTRPSTMYFAKKYCNYHCRRLLSLQLAKCHILICTTTTYYNGRSTVAWYDMPALYHCAPLPSDAFWISNVTWYCIVLYYRLDSWQAGWFFKKMISLKQEKHLMWPNAIKWMECRNWCQCLFIGFHYTSL